MNVPEKNELLNEVLGGEELNAFRDATLAHGMGAMRRRTRRRRQFQAVAIMSPLLVLALHSHFQRAIPVVLKSAPTPTAVAQIGNIKYITEKELFALFPNRPIALIGEPGHQQFLLLNELKPNRE